jgi:predicted nucleic acid-binding protein
MRPSTIRTPLARPVFMPDSNVLIDLLDVGEAWHEWSSSAVADSRRQGRLITNQVIFAEVSVLFQRLEEVRHYFDVGEIAREDVPWDAAFLAGQAHLAYRRRGGIRISPLPDFFIGAHALVHGYTLVTRDARRYRTYFPNLNIISPGT